MRESEIEKYLVDRCDDLGIHRDKFSSPSKRNVPDNILIYDGRIIFVELKAPDKCPNEAQFRDHAKRRNYGATTLWTDSKEGVESILQLLINDAAFHHTKY